MKRIDRASKYICAPVSLVYGAFRDGKAMESWLPPEGMTGKMLAFDFRQGGFYRMRLTYDRVNHPPGKSAENADDVEVRFVRLAENRSIEQRVTFESDDPRFSGVMKIFWRFRKIDNGTKVSITCENVPEGISREDHEAGISASLENLAKYIEDKYKHGS